MTDIQNLLAGMVMPLEWASEPPYRVARVLKGHYAIEFVETYGYQLRGSFAFGNYPTLEAAKAAAQADCIARILAALNPDAVLALVAAAYAGAAQTIDTTGDSAVTEALGQQLCCNGHHCGCQGADVGAFLLHLIRALTPTDATAALARMLAEARAEGLEMAAEYCNGDEPGDFWPNLRAAIHAMKEPKP